MVTHPESARRSVVVIASLSLLSACAGSLMQPALVQPNPYKFPTQADVTQIAAQPVPSTFFPAELSEVDTWTVHTTRPTLSERPAPDGLAFVRETRVLLHKAHSSTSVSDALSCVAEETARFALERSTAPSRRISDFIAARCGSPYASTGFRSLLLNTGRADEAAVHAQFSKQLWQALEPMLATNPQGIGVGYARVDGKAMLLVSGGTLRAKVDDTALVSDAEGKVVLSGTLQTKPEAIMALVNRGPHQAAPCERDEGVLLPNFRLTCKLDAQDSSAWIEVLTRDPGRALLDLALPVLALRSDAGGDVNTLSLKQKDPLAVANAQDFEMRAAQAINEVRAAAQLPPLAAQKKQGDMVRVLAPHFFHAQHVTNDREEAERIGLGLLAGWQVDRVIRNGSFVSAVVGPTSDVHSWVSDVLDRPIGRLTLLSKDARALALGGVVSNDPTMLGALAFTYEFADQFDHAADARALASRIDRARQSTAETPAEHDRLLTVAVETMAASLTRGEVTPNDALYAALENAQRATQQSVRGFAMAAQSLDGMDLPEALLARGVKRFGVATGHYQPPGSTWAVEVALIVYTEE